MSASFLRFIPLVVAAAALAACSSTAPDEAESVVEEALSARSLAFVGKYDWQPSGAFLDFERLELHADGSYAGLVDSGFVDPGVRCFRFPCTLGEEGRWGTVMQGGKLRLRFRPEGNRPSRSYVAGLDASTDLTLTRLGRSTTLARRAVASCAAMLCEEGTLCIEGDDGGECVPAPSCAAMLCAPNTTCVDGPRGGECVPDHAPSCAAMLCQEGTTCVDGPDGGECVPAPSCAAMLCAPNTTCVDGPRGGECVPSAPPPCVRTGCGGEVCADQQIFTTCEVKPGQACYAAAACERQSDGACGFTMTPSLAACLANP